MSRRPQPRTKNGGSARSPRLSLAMIVRDEAEEIKGSLQAVSGLADEIIVVDTGSRDATAEVARDAGARVFPFEWRQDFAAARNHALRQCRGQWVLQLDADERLDEEAREAVRRAIRGKKTGHYFLWLQNVTREGVKIGGRVRCVRLVRRAPGFHYAGRIHEQPVLPAGSQGRYSDATIQHHGYDPAIYAARGKRERNRELLELGLADTANGRQPALRSQYLYYLALAADGTERFELLEEFSRLVSDDERWLGARLPWIPAGLILFALELRNRGRHAESGRWAARLLDAYGSAPLLHALRAGSLLAEGRATEARAALQDALLPAAKIHHEYLIPEDLSTHLLQVTHAEWCERTGRDDEALTTYRKLLPRLEGVRLRASWLEAAFGRYPQALALLEADPLPIHRIRTEQACLGLVLSVLTQSKSGLLLWGERVRQQAPRHPLAAAVIARLEAHPAGRAFTFDDFPELQQALGWTAEPVRPASQPGSVPEPAKAP